jgi:hypothetical protein
VPNVACSHSSLFWANLQTGFFNMPSFAPPTLFHPPPRMLGEKR